MHDRTLDRGRVRFARRERDPSSVHEAVAIVENPFALNSCQAGTLAADRGLPDSLEINSRQIKVVGVGCVLLRLTWRMTALWIVRRGELKMVMEVELFEMPLVVG